MSGVHSKNTRINMAGRLTEISNYKIPKGLSIDEQRVEFRENVLPEWVELKDENNHQNLHQIGDVKGDKDGPTGAIKKIPCICGQSLSAGYYKIYNVQNGNMAVVGSGCVKYVRDNNIQSMTPKQLKDKIKKKLDNSLTNTYNKLFFEDMNEYTQMIVSLICKEWTLMKTATYLKIFRDNNNISTMLIDMIHQKTLDFTTSYKASNTLNFNQKQKLYKDNMKLKQDNFKLTKEMTKLETSLNRYKVKEAIEQSETGYQPSCFAGSFN